MKSVLFFITEFLTGGEEKRLKEVEFAKLQHDNTVGLEILQQPAAKKWLQYFPQRRNISNGDAIFPTETQYFRSHKNKAFFDKT